MPLRFATHSKRVQKVAVEYGWQPSARYTNLRDVQDFDKVNFIDICLNQNYGEKTVIQKEKDNPIIHKKLNMNQIKCIIIIYQSFAFFIF